MGTAAAILAILVFSTVLCIIEIPKLLEEKLYKELWTFSILITLGTVLTILVSLNVEIPNTSDFTIWFFSPFKSIIQSLLK